jgi:DNA mismatch endonuclease (patch repair protein)
MAHIPTRDTAPERALRAALERIGVGPIAANDPGLPGSPDVVLPAARVALFAHGCFWHHHAGCRCARVPATAYPWTEKFRRNRERDLANRDALLHKGWRVGWIWECALIGQHALPQTQLEAALQGFVAGATTFLDLAGTRIVRARVTDAPCALREGGYMAL